MPKGLRYNCYVCFLALFTLSFSAISQDIKQDSHIGIRGYYGTILRHDHLIGHLMTHNPLGIELSWEKPVSSKIWAKDYNFPIKGFSISHYNPRDEAIGTYTALTNYWTFYLKKGISIKQILTFGWGLAYNSNPYHSISNSSNNITGSYINYNLFSGYGLDIPLGKLHLLPRLSLVHFSNGAYKVPNKGLNNFLLNLGVNYTLKESRIVLPNHPYRIDSSLKYIIAIGMGIKEIHGEKEKYPIYTLSGGIAKRINRYSGLHTSLDLFVNYGHQAEMKQDIIFREGSIIDFKRIGLSIGHELFISKTSFISQLGAYLYAPYNNDAPIYARFALKRHLSFQWSMSLSLKTHWAIADFMELTIEYQL